MKSEIVKREIRLRIRVVDPPPGVVFCLQRGRGELVSPVMADGSELVFDLSVRLGEARDESGPNFLGPFTQGPVSARFVYVNAGTSAGQFPSCWTRRVKVPLSGIDRALVEEALRSEASTLEARIAGRARDGGPACATVPLLDGGWRLVPGEGG